MMPPFHRHALPAALFLFALLAGCAGTPPQPSQIPACQTATPCPACPVCPAAPDTAESAAPPASPLQLSSWTALSGWQDDNPAAAWPALRKSCSVLARKPGWQSVCEMSARLGETPSPAGARQFFEAHFEPWQLVNPDGSREGLITGYYEPLIAASRTRSERYAWPVHGVPSDMLTVELGDLYPSLKSMRLRGRIVGNRIVPYWSRSELEQRGGALPADILFWAADPIDLFFLQVQGSGQLRLPDGSRARIGYADQNGHPYQSIGRWLVSQGELPLEQASMEGIRLWAQKHPARLHELLNANPSYVFFRELSAEGGPTGALGIPITAERSLAVDPASIPLGAPVFLSTTYPRSERPLNRLMLAQDTGGAIKGRVRADFFWGFGAEAGTQAGRMRQQGRLWVLLPKGMQP